LKYGFSGELIKVTRVPFGMEYCDTSTKLTHTGGKKTLKLMYHQTSEKHHTQVRKTLEANVLRWSKETQKHNEDIHI